MTALYISSHADGNGQVVRRPRPADAVGAALNGVFAAGSLPPDWHKLLRRLDRAH